MVSLRTIRRVSLEGFGEFMIILSASLIVSQNISSKLLLIVVIFILSGIILRIFGDEFSKDIITKKFWKRFFRLTK